MGHSLFSLQRTGLGAIVFLSLTAAAHASPVNTIFAVENALYGQGYDVGEADGWLDGDLRAAIKAFQGRNSGLLSTGDLDPETLKALGIDSGYTAVTRNTLPNRRAAMAALGIEPRYQKPEPRTAKPTVAATPEPEPAPQPEAKEPPPGPEAPEPAASVAATPEPEAVIETTMAVETAEKAPPVPEDTDTTAVVEAAPKAPQSKSETAANAPEPAPAPEPVAALHEPASAEPVAAAVETVAAVKKTEASDTRGLATEDEADNMTASTNPQTAPSAEAQADASQETEASVAEDRPEDTGQSVESNGGFFSMLFDFLFGWAV